MLFPKEIPQRLEIKIFQGRNALPILEQVKASVDSRGLVRYELSEEDEITLLARPQTAWLLDVNNSVKYNRIIDDGQADFSRRGSKLFVAYERAND